MSELTDRQKERRIFMLQNLEPLRCDLCSIEIGKVFEGDLNGTLIVCNTCGSVNYN